MQNERYELEIRPLNTVVPQWLQEYLGQLCQQTGEAMYLTGGLVRDVLRGVAPGDVDLTVAKDARNWARMLVELSGGTYVPLGRDEDAVRVVINKQVVDISAFRQGAQTIDEELHLRDLTINAMAVRVDPLFCSLPTAGESVETLPLIDPTGGLADLRAGCIRKAGANSFLDDPLRMLRVFRFAALVGAEPDAATLEEIETRGRLIHRVAPERIAYELGRIMESVRAHNVFQSMANTGLLWELIPALAHGKGMVQPQSHHLDVWEHNLEALAQMEHIVAAPGKWFPDSAEILQTYLTRERVAQLKWAALLHDVGKPAAHAVQPEKQNRITFYNHDEIGAVWFREWAEHYRWSTASKERVAGFIANHMYPFHLLNVARTANLTLKACIRMVKKLGDELPGLFCLALADALAGQGSGRMVGIETELAGLLEQLTEVQRTHIQPVRSGAPLVNGKDLLEIFALQPGPVFREILEAVEEEQMLGHLAHREEALHWIQSYIEDQEQRRAHPLGNGE